MGFLDGIEKLINEHGSATILKERITLANDKYAALEQKFSESELSVKKSESENEALRLDNSKLQEQLCSLKKELSEISNHPFKFDESSGTWVGDNSNTRYCARCKTQNISSPMTNESSGWRCPACDGYFPDPSRKAQTFSRPPPNWRV